MKNNISFIYEGLVINVNISGIMKNHMQVIVNDEEVYSKIMAIGTNPVNQIFFYYKNKKYTMYYIFYYLGLLKAQHVVMINNSIVYGNKENLRRVIKKNRVLIRASKYFSKKTFFYRLTLYSLLSGLSYAMLMQVFQLIEKGQINMKYFLFHFAFFGLFMGLFRWYYLNNMKPNGIDDIDISSI